jgi:hypothetical protein
LTEGQVDAAWRDVAERALDFGERFVSGYKAVSTVDLLMDAPFDE